VPLLPRLPGSRQLQRERRTLLQTREERLRDLGGLMLEMYRRDQFRRELLVDRCTELVELEERLAELDAELAVGSGRPAARCGCGGTIYAGAKFCSQCGRPVAGLS
jgi:hypothetical protein